MSQSFTKLTVFCLLLFVPSFSYAQSTDYTGSNGVIGSYYSTQANDKTELFKEYQGIALDHINVIKNGTYYANRMTSINYVGSRCNAGTRAKEDIDALLYAVKKDKSFENKALALSYYGLCNKKISFINDLYTSKFESFNDVDQIDKLKDMFKKLRGKYRLSEEDINSKKFESFIQQIDIAYKIPVEIKDGKRMKALCKVKNEINNFIKQQTGKDFSDDACALFGKTDKELNKKVSIQEIGKDNLKLERTYREIRRTYEPIVVADFSDYGGGVLPLGVDPMLIDPLDEMSFSKGNMLVDSKNIKWECLGETSIEESPRRVSWKFSRIDDPKSTVIIGRGYVPDDGTGWKQGEIKHEIYEYPTNVYEVHNKLMNKNIKIMIPDKLEPGMTVEKAYEHILESIAFLPKQYADYVTEISYNAPDVIGLKSRANGAVETTTSNEIFLLDTDHGVTDHEATHLVGFYLRKLEGCPVGWEEAVSLDGKGFFEHDEVFKHKQHAEDFAYFSSAYMKIFRMGNNLDEFVVKYPNRSAIINHMLNPDSKVLSKDALYMVLVPSALVVFSAEQTDDKDGGTRLKIHDIIPKK